VLIGVSLKAYFGHAQTLAWAGVVAELAAKPAIADRTVELFVIPSFPELAEVRSILDGTPIRLGAQDVFWEDRGPYTGEVTGDQLAELGVSLVEIGHAERRRLFHETDEVVAAKCAAASRNGLQPLLCIGERTRGTEREAVSASAAQLASANAPDALVAWEPVWAIGADRPAEPEYIRAVCDGLRESLGGRRLIYGGSAGPGLLAELHGSVDGLFLGRFAHDVAALADVIDEAAQSAG
jgi:triosephosphate isomerase